MARKFSQTTCFVLNLFRLYTYKTLSDVTLRSYCLWEMVLLGIHSSLDIARIHRLREVTSYVSTVSFVPSLSG